jgi:hypothetical protein
MHPRHDPPKTPDIVTVKTRQPKMTVSIPSTTSPHGKQKKRSLKLMNEYDDGRFSQHCHNSQEHGNNLHSGSNKEEYSFF